MGIKIGGKVEKVDGKEIGYKEFVERYMENNQPVVLTGLMDDWRACRDWVTEDGQPNLDFFSSRFGKSNVQVAECGRREFTDQKRVELSVSDFIRHWLEISSKKCAEYSVCKRNDPSLLYLKDWHFAKEYPEYVAYTTPLFFRDDWLNLYLDRYHMHTDPDTYREKNEISCSDYRFVYMGAKGTWTPLHADVFRSYSWSANICGKKQWHFLSPSQCHLLFDRNMKKSVYDIFDDVPETKFPGFEKAIWLECTQDQNEIIFVPSGWYHQVHNIEDTISINHNWFNAYNLSWVWKLLLKDYEEAKEYIEDIRDISDDFEGLCQRNLLANTGMNFRDFFNLITRFSFANLIQLYLNKKNSEIATLSSPSSTKQLMSNLTFIKKIALSMKSTDSMKGWSNVLFDVRKVVKVEPQFLDLCTALGKTYGLPDQPLTTEFIRLDYIGATCSAVSSLDDLITVINSVLTDIGSDSCDDTCSLLSKWDELEISTVV